MLVDERIVYDEDAAIQREQVTYATASGWLLVAAIPSFAGLMLVANLADPMLREMVRLFGECTQQFCGMLISLLHTVP